MELLPCISNDGLYIPKRPVSPNRSTLGRVGASLVYFFTARKGYVCIYFCPNHNTKTEKEEARVLIFNRCRCQGSGGCASSPLLSELDDRVRVSF
jgi:Pyruvate/2-oxoacid:ferredoxin oxidoreductase delta subunit